MPRRTGPRKIAPNGSKYYRRQIDHPLYRVWQGMKTRCYCVTSIDYLRYGGRGIRVCERWRTSFVAFIEDIGDRPPGMTLDRIDSDGDYEPSNCRWATPKQQCASRRTTHLITVDGITLNAYDWAKRFGFSHQCIYGQIKKRGPVEAVRYLQRKSA